MSIFSTIRPHYHNPRKTVRQLLEEELECVTREHYQAYMNASQHKLRASQEESAALHYADEIERIAEELAGLPLDVHPLKWWERLLGRHGTVEQDAPAYNPEQSLGSGRFPSDSHSIPEAMTGAMREAAERDKGTIPIYQRQVAEELQGRTRAG